MQITLTIPPDVIQQVAAYITADINRKWSEMIAETPHESPEALLTLQMAAKRLKLHQKTIVNYIRKGKINASNCGTLARPKYRISQADCDAFYRANRSR